MNRLLALACGLAGLLWAAAAPAQDFRPIGPEQARLIVSPTAFGNINVARSVYESGAARYERWTTRVDPTRRFYQLLLREAPPQTIVLETLDLQRTAREMMGDAGRGLVFEPPQSLVTNLGPTDYGRFNLGAIGCVVFHTVFGDVIQGYPANVLKGIYCDPAVPRLPDYDIGNTLNAIGVYGYFEPPPPPPPVIVQQPLPIPAPLEPEAPIYTPNQPFPNTAPEPLPPPVLQPFPQTPPKQTLPNPFPNP